MAWDSRLGNLSAESTARSYALIRETIRSMDEVAIGRVVLTSREHII